MKITGFQQAHMNLRIWRCEDARIQASTNGWGDEDTRMWVYKLTLMNLRIWGCEYARIRASTHEPEDIRMKVCRQGHMNLRIRGCKNAMIRASTHEQKVWGCDDASKCTGKMRRYKQVKISNMKFTSRLLTCRLLQFTSHKSI